MIEATTATFDEIVKGADGPVVVDFWATWCGPCRPVKAELEKMSADYTIVTVDSDAEPELSRRYGVMSLPTVIVFVAGEEKERTIGWRGPSHLKKTLAPYAVVR